MKLTLEKSKQWEMCNLGDLRNCSPSSWALVEKARVEENSLKLFDGRIDW